MPPSKRSRAPVESARSARGRGGGASPARAKCERLRQRNRRSDHRRQTSARPETNRGASPRSTRREPIHPDEPGAQPGEVRPVLIAGILVVCVVLLVLAFVFPRLSRHPERGVDKTLGAGQRPAACCRDSSAAGRRSHSASRARRRARAPRRGAAAAPSCRTSSSGGGGIRTPGPGSPDSDFQDRRIRPLCHPSWGSRFCPIGNRERLATANLSQNHLICSAFVIFEVRRGRRTACAPTPQRSSNEEALAGGRGGGRGDRGAVEHRLEPPRSAEHHARPRRRTTRTSTRSRRRTHPMR